MERSSSVATALVLATLGATALHARAGHRDAALAALDQMAGNERSTSEASSERSLRFRRTETFASSWYRGHMGWAQWQAFVSTTFVRSCDPNGIAVTSDGRYALVAGWHGIIRVDLETRETMRLRQPASIASGCIDGLYRSAPNEVIGVQNCVHDTGRVLRFRLTRELDAIVSAEVLRVVRASPAASHA